MTVALMADPYRMEFFVMCFARRACIPGRHGGLHDSQKQINISAHLPERCAALCGEVPSGNQWLPLESYCLGNGH